MTDNLKVVQIVQGYRMGEYLDTITRNKDAFMKSVLKHE